MKRLLLYSRVYCHLCEDMEKALDAVRPEFAFELEIVDIDAEAIAEPALLTMYDELVPVLVAVTADGAVHHLCHHFLDPDAVRTFLAGPHV